MLLILAMSKQNPNVVNKAQGYAAIKRLNCITLSINIASRWCYSRTMRLCHISYCMYVHLKLLSISNTQVYYYSTSRISHYILHTYNVGRMNSPIAEPSSVLRSTLNSIECSAVTYSPLMFECGTTTSKVTSARSSDSLAVKFG